MAKKPKNAAIYDMDVEQLLADCVGVDPTKLDEEFVRMSSDLAYWNFKHAEAVETFQIVKHAREQTAARLHVEMREELVEQAEAAAEEKGGKVKAPTVADIEAAITTHGDHCEVRDAEIAAERRMREMQGLVEALRTKRDMLIQLGADRRAEMAADPMLRK